MFTLDEDADEIVEIAARGARLGCAEALFTLGDRPEDRWPEARAWLDEQGYDSTLAYVHAHRISISPASSPFLFQC